MHYWLSTQLQSGKTGRRLNLMKFLLTVSEVKERQMRYSIITLLFLVLSCLGTNTQTHRLSIFGSAEETRQDIKAGFDVNARYEYNSTPLMIASMFGRDKNVQVLIDANAKINLTDDFGSTALHEAARQGHLDVVKKLVDAGAIVDKKNIYDLTPLHLATTGGRIGVIEYLISIGADVNAVDIEGSSVLYRVRSWTEHVPFKKKIENLLVKHGAVDLSNSAIRDLTLEELVKRKKTSTNNDDTQN